MVNWRPDKASEAYLRAMQATYLLHGCPIFIEPLETTLPEWLQTRVYSNVLIIADEHTHQFCLPIINRLQLPVVPTLCVIPAGESFKDLDTCALIWRAMENAGLDRKALVINLGGGVIGDMGGFCAATWKRGIDFIQIPTTLLSMTDAAIGGKVGIDFHALKNVIGLIRQPAGVFIDPVFLHTLPQRELHSGMAEIVKHAAISHELDRPWVHQLPHTPDWFETLRASVGIKVRIVEEDPHESGLRMLLNFGHTIGHALESYYLHTPSPFTHGEAITIGMICEQYLQPAQNLHANLLKKQLMSIFKLDPIPLQAVSSLWMLMQQDKKNASGKVRIALPDALPFTMQVLEITQADLERSLLHFNK
ncbi:MAG: 3-dehydroquinate synthase [Saprospiraceae bacterium]|nr:3-dehydroquinate synthase [Saprospiraceae bacterium]